MPVQIEDFLFITNFLFYFEPKYIGTERPFLFAFMHT